MNKKLLYFFAFLAILWALISWVGFANAKGLIHLSEIGSMQRSALLMWTPGAAALLARAACGERLMGSEWGRGPARYMWGAYLIPLGYALAGYLVIWMGGWGTFPNGEVAEQLGRGLGVGPSHPWVAVAICFLLVGTLHVLSGLHLALGEEVGWRGLLLPELKKHCTTRQATLIVGVIWFAWHIPSMAWNGYGNGAPRAFTLGVFFVVVMAVSVIMTWVFERTGSVWAAALLHASHNAFYQDFFDPLTRWNGESAKYTLGEFGIPAALMTCVVAGVAWSKLGEASKAKI